MNQVRGKSALGLPGGKIDAVYPVINEPWLYNWWKELLTKYYQAHAYMDVGGRATQDAKAE